MISPSLDVALHNQKIGKITYLGQDRTIFTFDESYVQDPHRKTLSLSFTSQTGQLIADHPPTQTQLLPWFSNLLPEGPLRNYLAEQAGVKPMREYPLIEALGKDLPGAVTLIPPEGHPHREGENTSSEDIRSADMPLKFSLAGVQLKFSALAQQKGGLTLPAQGLGGNWIIKLPSLRYEGLSRNEFSMMSLAHLMGMNVPQFNLTPLTDIEGLPQEIDHIAEEAFAIQRFDRQEDGNRLHIEDFAQVFRVYPDRKYERASLRSIASVLWITTEEQDVREFVKRMIFNTLIGNADMHLKNWSLIYPDQIKPRLAPVYDFVSTIPYIKDKNAALTYARTKEMAKLDQDELSYFASKSRIPERLVLDETRKTVEQFLELWHAHKNQLPLSKHVIGVIENHFNSLALLNL